MSTPISASLVAQTIFLFRLVYQNITHIFPIFFIRAAYSISFLLFFYYISC
jgi:hypothetical protein